MLRGFAFTAAMVVVRLLQGTLINAWQAQAGLISVGLLALFITGIVAWGLVDGRTDATANPDTDHRQDFAMTWLLAGLIAGVTSGAISWLVSTFYQGLYAGGLINELTTFAAFTALLVFAIGVSGVAVGRWQVDRQREKQPVQHHGLATDQERTAHTDVFAAVRTEETPTGEISLDTTTVGTQAEQPTAAIATVEREQPIEMLPADTDESTPGPEPTQN